MGGIHGQPWLYTFKSQMLEPDPKARNCSATSQPLMPSRITECRRYPSGSGWKHSCGQNSSAQRQKRMATVLPAEADWTATWNYCFFPEWGPSYNHIKTENWYGCWLRQYLSEFLKHMGPLATEWLTSFFTRIVQEKRTSKVRPAKTIAISKPNKDDPIAANYWPVSLLSVC